MEGKVPHEHENRPVTIAGRPHHVVHGSMGHGPCASCGRPTHTHFHGSNRCCGRAECCATNSVMSNGPTMLGPGTHGPNAGFTNGPSLIAKPGRSRRMDRFAPEHLMPFSSLGGKDARAGEVKVELGSLFLEPERKSARKHRDELVGESSEGWLV